HIFHQYVVRVPGHRDDFKKSLAASGITTKTYYPLPLHLQKCFGYFGYHEGDFPQAESAARETLALPLFPELTEEQMVYVLDVCRRFFQEL
ncbi:MAG TPA: DegT/DnrJ/EryC1/StrS family aminotransferase, partial [Pyrinomonadaceae bacterium]